MSDTIGYRTIKDRTSGWGSGYGAGGSGTKGYVDPALQPVADAAKEALATRVTRILAERKQGNANTNPQIAERHKGNGGVNDKTAGADAGYRTGGVAAIWTTESLIVGSNTDIDYTGSNTEHTTTDSEALASGRTADSRTTVKLDDATLAKRNEAAKTSILDRTSGWGHTAGSLTYRND